MSAVYSRGVARAIANKGSGTVRSLLDSAGRSNVNKRGPKTAKVEPQMMRINHKHAAWCKAHGYAFNAAHLLSDAEYEALCLLK